MGGLERAGDMSQGGLLEVGRGANECFTDLVELYSTANGWSAAPPSPCSQALAAAPIGEGLGGPVVTGAWAGGAVSVPQPPLSPS